MEEAGSPETLVALYHVMALHGRGDLHRTTSYKRWRLLIL
jgi:hypothetical protein